MTQLALIALPRTHVPAVDPHIEDRVRPRAENQNTLVLHRLRRASLTPMQALTELGVMRLAARIKDLREAGYNIETTRGDGGVAIYTLVQP
jgi:biotin operon repressor